MIHERTHKRVGCSCGSCVDMTEFKFQSYVKAFSLPWHTDFQLSEERWWSCEGWTAPLDVCSEDARLRQVLTDQVNGG